MMVALAQPPVKETDVEDPFEYLAMHGLLAFRNGRRIVFLSKRPLLSDELVDWIQRRRPELLKSLPREPGSWRSPALEERNVLA
jgi:hypothetical protein